MSVQLGSKSYTYFCFMRIYDSPEQRLALEHIPSINTILLLQKQPLVQSGVISHPVSVVILVQVKFQLHVNCTIPEGHPMYTTKVQGIAVHCIYAILPL